MSLPVGSIASMMGAAYSSRPAQAQPHNAVSRLPPPSDYAHIRHDLHTACMLLLSNTKPIILVNAKHIATAASSRRCKQPKQ